MSGEAAGDTTGECSAAAGRAFSDSEGVLGVGEDGVTGSLGVKGGLEANSEGSRAI